MREALERAAREDLARRLWAGDPDLWRPGEPAHAAIIRQRLGWLRVATTMQGEIDRLAAFANEVRRAGFRQAVLLGMGGSSLAPEVLRRTFGVAPGYLDLAVLDTTDPATILRTERGLDLPRTLFIVASKSGTTIETTAQFAYFYERLRTLRGRVAGEQFVAITDPGTPLAELARDRGFRAAFLNPPDIGGRYSALSLFGLVPAALLGLDLRGLLERATQMMAACGPEVPAAENPGLALGVTLAVQALAGRDKVTLVLPPPLASFGAWVEQLVAESTGKEGRGILPVDGEPLGMPVVYGRDRVFVALRMAGAADAAQAQRLAALEAAGHPVVRLDLADVLALGGEFFRWAFATAVAGALLGVNPFDEPNVQESKDATKRVLAAAAEGQLPEPEPALVAEGLALYGDVAGGALDQALAAFLAQARDGDYLALHAYLPYDPAIAEALQTLRVALRDRLRLATTVGFGPRFLHSTGQLHKGGPNNGLFLQLTADDVEDAAVPGEAYTFGVLKRAQALGDFVALRARGRRIVRIHLGADALAGLRLLDAAARRAR
jgi:glucose-6-phosphate isomerase